MKIRLSILSVCAIPLLFPLLLVGTGGGGIFHIPMDLFNSDIELCFGGIDAHGGFIAGENVVVEEDETIDDDLVVLGGSIKVHGRVMGDLVAIGGSLDVTGEVRGDAVAVGGSIRITSTGWIEGDAVAIGGKVGIEEGGRLSGEQVSLAFLPMNWDFTFGFPWFFFFSPFFLLMKIGKVLTWLILSILIVALFPAQVKVGATQLQEKFLWDGLIGMLIFFAFLASVCVSIILCFLLVGIPILFVLLLGYFVTKLFGLTTVFYWIGGRLLDAEKHSPFALVGLGGLILGVLRFAPVLGWTIWFIAGLVGLGMAVITRYGTEVPAQPTPPAPTEESDL